MRPFKLMIWAVAGVTLLAACGDPPTTDDTDRTGEAPATDQTFDFTTDAGSAATSLLERIDDIDQAVATWRSATSIDAAQVAAEEAANLVVGPNGPGYGDRNGDGVVGGDTTVGVLPGLDGTPAGLATPLAGNDCVGRDVLGGTWNDPDAEWEAMLIAIDDWRTDNNTMPSLASHPMRIVGWATLALRSDSLDEAHEYAGHAKLHVDVSLRALDC